VGLFRRFKCTKAIIFFCFDGFVLGFREEGKQRMPEKGKANVEMRRIWASDGSVHDEEQILRASQIMEEEWTSSGVKRRMERMFQGGRKLISVALVVDGVLQCHARIQPVADHLRGDGPSCAVTSVITSTDVRGKGFGRKLMDFVEEVAKVEGYKYVYLWTDSAEGFYQKCAYKRCEPINLDVPALQGLDEDSVSSLEAMLNQKLLKTAELESRTSLVEHAAPGGLNTIWMRKRLMISNVSIVREESAARNEIEQTLNRIGNHGFVFFMENLHWQRQIGPSCGLTALRLARGFLEDGVNLAEEYGLLESALTLGMTDDGEIFDIDGLARLARDCCELEAVVQVCTSSGLIEAVLSNGVVVFPYDKGVGNGPPECRGGSRAHYCVFVGMARQNPSKAENHEMIQKEAFKSIVTVDVTSVLLVATHGTSKSLVVAPIADWIASNGQLHPKKRADANLAGKFLACNRRAQ